MRRKVGFLFIVCAAIPISVFAATAWACGTLVTLSVTPKVAKPGETLTVTGRNWGGTPTFTNVQLRWGSRTAPVLQEVTPPDLQDADGTQLQVPANAKPGWYVLTGTQFSVSNGAPKTGSPGRTTVRVQGAAGGSAAPWGAATPTGPGGPGGSPDVPLPGVLLSAALLATGFTLVARDRRKRGARPAAGV